MLLTENPNGFRLEGKSYDTFKGHARAFGFYKNEAYISDYGGIHNRLLRTENKSFLGRFDFNYPGRIWEEPKVISFWEYPKPSELEEYIKLLENKNINLGSGNWGKLKIWNNNYQIIILEYDNNSNLFNNKSVWTDKEQKERLIPLETYTSLKITKEQSAKKK